METRLMMRELRVDNATMDKKKRKKKANVFGGVASQAQ